MANATDKDKERARVVAEDQKGDWPLKSKEELMIDWAACAEGEEGHVTLQVLLDIRDVLFQMSGDIRSIRGMLSVTTPFKAEDIPPSGRIGEGR